jgi:hypothetical protein
MTMVLLERHVRQIMGNNVRPNTPEAMQEEEA